MPLIKVNFILKTYFARISLLDITTLWNSSLPIPIFTVLPFLHYPPSSRPYFHSHLKIFSLSSLPTTFIVSPCPSNISSSSPLPSSTYPHLTFPLSFSSSLHPHCLPTSYSLFFTSTFLTSLPLFHPPPLSSTPSSSLLPLFYLLYLLLLPSLSSLPPPLSSSSSLLSSLPPPSPFSPSSFSLLSLLLPLSLLYYRYNPGHKYLQFKRKMKINTLLILLES